MMVEIKSHNWEEFVMEGQKVLVDFYADWCQPCKALSAVLEELIKESYPDAYVLKFNIDNDEEGSITGRYGIKGIPTLIYFKRGEIRKVSVGTKPKSELKELFEFIKND